MIKKVPPGKVKKLGPLVSVIMGSSSDYSVMKEAVQLLALNKIPFEKKVVSAHRSPKLMCEYANSARARGIKIIIAGAGGAAHLPGMVAAFTELPVIGVPIGNGVLEGHDALLSIAQMPPGVPVATVGINGAHNAALLAMQMLGFYDLLRIYKKKLLKKVLKTKV